MLPYIVRSVTCDPRAVERRPRYTIGTPGESEVAPVTESGPKSAYELAMERLRWLPAPNHEHLLRILANPLVRLTLVALAVLSLFHWAHRFRHTLYDGLQIKHLNEVIAVVSYGVAIAGSAAAVYVIMRVP